MFLGSMRFVSAQPATLYYAWQVEVMLNNFMEMGVNPNQVDIVCWKENGVIPNYWSKLAEGYPARFFFYDDKRETKHYISSIRPNILKQHWEKYPDLKYEAIFYHDCDIIFTKPVTEWVTEDMITDDKWYGSDTRWYIGHSYIKSKGDDVINKMCEIMELPQSLIQLNEMNAIGAQYLMKGITYEFWDRVERDSERLFKEISELNQIKKQSDPTHHELQIWCADMWAVLWGGWRMGYESICHSNFDFSWGTSNNNDYHKMNIMHNAGVTNSNDGLFYKAEYINELPYGKNLNIIDGTASWYYYQSIKKTEQKSKIYDRRTL
jgi:hypothetical protein